MWRLKEAIGGYIMIRAESLDEAAEISKGCPILTIGGNVEVRALFPMEMSPSSEMMFIYAGKRIAPSFIPDRIPKNYFGAGPSFWI